LRTDLYARARTRVARPASDRSNTLASVRDVEPVIQDLVGDGRHAKQASSQIKGSILHPAEQITDRRTRRGRARRSLDPLMRPARADAEPRNTIRRTRERRQHCAAAFEQRGGAASLPGRELAILSNAAELPSATPRCRRGDELLGSAGYQQRLPGDRRGPTGQAGPADAARSAAAGRVPGTRCRAASRMPSPEAPPPGRQGCTRCTPATTALRERRQRRDQLAPRAERAAGRQPRRHADCRDTAALGGLQLPELLAGDRRGASHAGPGDTARSAGDAGGRVASG
jgi:hypothetical protein